MLKNGGATLTLNGSHSMSGVTTVNQGTLALNGSLGGSVIKDKLFFFSSYEYQRTDTPNFGNASVLSQPTVLVAWLAAV